MTNYNIKRYNPYTDEELIEAGKKYAIELGKQYVDADSFCNWFGISKTTIQRHFGTWVNFCQKVGLSPRYHRSVSKEDLFNNLDMVWSKLGRQPRNKEMKQPLSQISNSRYHRFFRKTWYDVCLEFISWKSGASIDEIEKDTRQIDNENIGKNSQHETNRNINLSLRYEVLKRDNFRCIKCGVSPAISLGVQLHIDHIIPWSKGGETELTNLQTLCSDCNLGKSNKIDS